MSFFRTRKTLLQWSLLVLAAGPWLLAARKAAGAEVRLSIHFPGSARVVFSPDSKLLALQCSDRVEVYDVPSRKRLWADPGVRDPQAEMTASLSLPVQFSPDGALLAVPEVWSEQAMMARRVADSVELARNPAAVQRNPALLMQAANPTVGVQLRDAKTGTFRRKVGAISFHGWQWTDCRLLFAPDGKSFLTMHVALDSGQSVIEVYDVASGKRSAAANAGGAYLLSAAAVAPDGKTLAAIASAETVQRAGGAVVGMGGGAAPYTLVLWDLPKIKPRKPATTAAKQVALDLFAPLVFSADGKEVMTAGAGGVTVWDVQKGWAVRTIAPPGRTARQPASAVKSLRLRPDGTLTVLTETGIWLGDPQTGTARLVCSSSSGFTPEGILSASGGLALVADFQYAGDAPPKPGKAARTAPQVVAGFSVKQGFALWDANKGVKLATLMPKEAGEAGPLGGGSSIAFSPDESLVASAPGDGVVTVWDITADRPAASRDAGTQPAKAAAKPVPRTWTSADGRFTVEAEFVAAAGDKITLKKQAGGQVEIPLAKLSKADREYVEGLTK
jgi:WD40 repeat protein